MTFVSKMANNLPLCSIFLIAVGIFEGLFGGISLLPARIYSRVCFSYEYFLSNASGEIEKENFAYYALSYNGTILVELTSLSGDCDLYVSQTKKKPTYEPNSYCLQSSTCGVDTVIIPKSFKRPVGIGIFAYPSHEACAYNLMFFKIHDSRDIFNYDPYEEEYAMPFDNPMEAPFKNEHKMAGDTRTADQEEESLFWVFLRSLVVLLIESIV